MEHDNTTPPEPAVAEPPVQQPAVEVPAIGTPIDQDAIGDERPSEQPIVGTTTQSDPAEPVNVETPQVPPAPSAAPTMRGGRWTRPRQGRILAGVAAGVAAHTELPPWFVRAVFAISSFAGGFGVAVYLAGWALMPAEGETGAAADGWKDRFDKANSPSKKVGLGLIALGVLIALGTTGIPSSPLVLAALLVVAGLALTRPATDH